MTEERLISLLEIGENTAVEFKRCGNGIESDTYETVCSFLNRFGGHEKFRKDGKQSRHHKPYDIPCPGKDYI